MNLPAHLDELYYALPRERGTNIRALAYLLDSTDREIRAGIKELREVHGIAVICLPTQNGVWLSDDPAEVDALIRCQVSRARSLEESVRVLQRVRDRMAHSPSLF